MFYDPFLNKSHQFNASLRAHSTKLVLAKDKCYMDRNTTRAMSPQSLKLSVYEQLRSRTFKTQ